MLAEGKVEEETRYYLSSLPGEAQQIGEAVRRHWGVENGLHWVMDMVFRDDESRIRSDNAPPESIEGQLHHDHAYGEQSAASGQGQAQYAGESPPGCLRNRQMLCESDIINLVSFAACATIVVLAAFYLVGESKKHSSGRSIVPEIVYILTHPAMDGLIKIGRTNDLNERMRTLYNTSVPTPFTCYYAAWVGDSNAVEDDLGRIFGDRRVNPRREFYTADPHRVAHALRNHRSWLEDVENQVQVEQADIDATVRTEGDMERLGRTDFEMVDVPVDAELVFVDRESITCRVVSQRPPRVDIDGKVMSLSAAAKKVLNVAYGVNGTLFWSYEGETIWERRRRLGGA